MKTTKPNWKTRLAAHNASNYMASCPQAGSYESEMTLSFSTKDDFEYELEVTVFCEWEPAQNGGRTDPSWDAYAYAPSAFYFRPGHGWKEITLTESQESDIIEHFESQEPDCDGPDDYDDYDYNGEVAW